MLIFELGIVTVLIVTNGLLSMSELAIVSSRPARLAALAERNVKGSRRALALASDPGKFLSTVQIGITHRGRRLALRDRRSRWPAHRQAAGYPRKRRACPGRCMTLDFG